MSLLSVAARTVADWVKLGFPEEVAKRIASGELLMDKASRMKRAEEQGYGDVLYHGSTHDIKEFNGRGNPHNDWGEGTYFSDSTHDVNENYAGTHGSDFKSRWFDEKERLEAEYDSGNRPDLDDGDGSFDHWKAREEAIAKFQGDNQGVIYPVRVRRDGILSAVSDIDRPDYIEQARNELGLSDVSWDDMTDEAEESLWSLVDDLQANDYDHSQNSINKIASEYGVDDVPHLDDHETWSSVRDDLTNEYAEDEAGNYVGAGRMVGEIMQDLGANGVYDPTSTKRFDSMKSGKHTIMFPGSENQIRSVNAAFDPQYKGANMLGSALLPAATAGLLATQSDDAEAGFVTKGGKTLLEAFHGSPHKFDKFSMDAIGTGEGAQAYGHGLYFADSEDVAKQYRDELSETLRPKTWIPRIAKDNNIKLKSHAIDDFLHYGNAPNLSVEEAADAIIESVSGRKFDKDSFAGERSDLVNAISQLREETLYGEPMGHLYRTEIDVTPESLLDWDKPLIEQPNALKAFQEMYSDEAMRLDPETLGKLYSNPADVDMAALGLFDKSKGAQAYNTIKDMNYVQGAPAMSEKLREKGIKGIKYLDGDSRAAGNGTSNYVIFDDSKINIAERGSADLRLLAGIAAGGGGVSAATAMSNKLAAAQAVRQRGNIRAPNSGMLHGITMGARDLERRLEGHPAALLFPEGAVNYLEQLNKEERPSRETALWALLDMI